MNAETATMDPLANGSDDEENRSSIEERAEAEGEQAPEQDLFVLENGKEVGLGTLFRRGTPIELRFTLGSKSLPARDTGLMSFDDPELLLVVPVRAGDVRTSPTYDEDGTLKKVTIYADMKPRTIADARSARGKQLLGQSE